MWRDVTTVYGSIDRNTGAVAHAERRRGIERFCDACRIARTRGLPTNI
jgi:hypothetical protein